MKSKLGQEGAPQTQAAMGGIRPGKQSVALRGGQRGAVSPGNDEDIWASLCLAKGTIPVSAETMTISRGVTRKDAWEKGRAGSKNQDTARGGKSIRIRSVTTRETACLSGDVGSLKQGVLKRHKSSPSLSSLIILLGVDWNNAQSRDGRL